MTVAALKLIRVVAWGLALAILFFSLAPPQLRPQTAITHSADHFLIYAATGAAFAIGYGRKPGLLMLLFVIFSGSVEAAQLLVPGRHARLSDFVVDTLGLYTGLVVAVLSQQVRTRFGYKG